MQDAPLQYLRSYIHASAFHLVERTPNAYLPPDVMSPYRKYCLRPTPAFHLVESNRHRTSLTCGASCWSGARAESLPPGGSGSYPGARPLNWSLDRGTPHREVSALGHPRGEKILAQPHDPPDPPDLMETFILSEPTEGWQLKSAAGAAHTSPASDAIVSRCRVRAAGGSSPPGALVRHRYSMDPKDLLKPPNESQAVTGAHYSDKTGTVIDLFTTYRGGACVNTSTSSATSPAGLPDTRQPQCKQQLSGTVDPAKGLGNVPQPDLSKAVSLSMGLYMGEPDTKVMGNELGYTQQAPIGVPAADTDFKLLEESIASLQAKPPVPEGPEDKGGIKCDTSTQASPSAQSQGGSIGSSVAKLYSKDQSTFDLLQDLDLPAGSPRDGKGSPWELDPIFEDDTVGLLSPLTTDDEFLLRSGALNEDCKPLVMQDCTPKVEDLLLPNPEIQLSQVKTEKEDFIELCTPGVVKQEKFSPAYCSSHFSGSRLFGNKSSAISVHGVSTSGGQMYHYDLNTSPMAQKQPDQKPIFALGTTLSTISDSWNRIHGTGDDHTAGNVNYSGRPIFSNGYSRFLWCDHMLENPSCDIALDSDMGCISDPCSLPSSHGVNVTLLPVSDGPRTLLAAFRVRSLLAQIGIAKRNPFLDIALAQSVSVSAKRIALTQCEPSLRLCAHDAETLQIRTVISTM
ncbi:unnamed protein product [Ranitomeya imitator]|uniref:Glucocorticoid receptor n=1 Tax=Ranitomeya imitator TaxID=111125 RepID=A0ABN9L7Q9_9NEOB|nr:unnamed protein product [Ranitomeya imitator]